MSENLFRIYILARKAPIWLQIIEIENYVHFANDAYFAAFREYTLISSAFVISSCHVAGFAYSIEFVHTRYNRKARTMFFNKVFEHQLGITSEL